jgi:hypothetical protein
MPMTTDPAVREAFIDGLRALADFLAANPALPVSTYPVEIKVQPYGTHGTDEEKAREIDAFAAAAGVEVLDERDSTGYYSGRYSAALGFGPVRYETFTYTAAAMAESAAQRSYEGNVQVDAPAADMAEIARAA